MISYKKRFAILIFSLLLFLFLAEIGVRLLPFFPVNAMGLVMRPDPILDHSLRPNSRGRMKSREYDVVYRINSFGMRDELPKEKTILILGDSFMEGYGVNQNLILAARLRAMGHNVINAGTKSYSPLLEYLFLKHRGLDLKPDTVLLFFDLSDPANDDYYSRRLIKDSDGKPERITPRRSRILFPEGSAGEWLSEHSALYAYSVHAALKYFPMSDADIGYAGVNINMDPLFPGRDSIPDSDYFQRWDTSLVMLKEIDEFLKSKNIFFGLVTYPYGHEVSAGAWREGRKGHGFPPGVSSDRPFRFLERWAKENHVSIFSLDKVFKAYPNPNELYYTWDGHWTAKGHEVAAIAVDEWLRTYKKIEK
ncbi:TPA: hypothetical protein DEF17_06410 [bacterium]|nr:MAG: hypothetical protein AUJ18_00340 [Candidatus Hydrogenedentes bacterium CG1_02_42_14]PIU48134.1 MAG: hypothetical protein COS94_03805 [Candidatus Hydrogenedentes bacterium CG07_land_8_20_14_0_80_42_17]HBW47549.1 hypothetical protein [bacterium]